MIRRKSYSDNRDRILYYGRERRVIARAVSFLYGDIQEDQVKFHARSNYIHSCAPSPERFPGSPVAFDHRKSAT